MSESWAKPARQDVGPTPKHPFIEWAQVPVIVTDLRDIPMPPDLAKMFDETPKRKNGLIDRRYRIARELDARCRAIVA